MTLSDDDWHRVAASWLDKADQALADTATLLARGSVLGGMNRCYYSMFYALLGLAAHDHTTLHKHSALISYFHREYVKPGRLPRDLGQSLKKAFENRSESDYRTTVAFGLDDVSGLLEQARRFVAEVKALLKTT
jgi:uncharacterized protein (UPF0332 family)